MFRILIFLLLTAVFAKAQVPEFKNGLSEFIKNNTIYPAYSLNNCIQGIVNISFKLNAKAEVFNASISSGVGTDLDNEALRLIRMTSGKWTMPASHDTATVLIIPISFSLVDNNCSYRSKADIALAINAYKNKQDLTNMVSNFYKAKEKGLTQPKYEIKILEIKNQLGVDDDYLNQRINDGLNKIKQGDQLGACEDFNFVKYMGSDKSTQWITKYCN